MTQVDEKGHAGNTVVTAYVGGNMVKHIAEQQFLLTTTGIVYFEHDYTRTAVGRR